MQTPDSDPLIPRLREQISDNDRVLVQAINTRIELVARLKRYKDSRGLEFVDPEREQQILEGLTRMNQGPLSPEGLRAIFGEILALTKREVGRTEDGA